MQLEMEEPMHKLTILEVEKDDPNFTAKVLELIAKIVFAGVGNVYGKGLGLIGYAKKLNNYKDFNL